MLGGHHTATHLDDGRARRDRGVVQVHFALLVQQNRRAGPFANGRRNPFSHHSAAEFPVLAGAGEPVVHLCPAMAIVPVAGDVVVTVLVEVLRVVRVTIRSQGEDHRPAIDRGDVAVDITQRHGVPDKYLVAQYREVRTDQWLGGSGVVRADFQRIGSGPQAGLMGCFAKFLSVAFHREKPRP
jgi:hypothetical protein